MATPKPNRTLPGSTLLRYTEAQKERWELARRAAEAQLPPGERLSMQAWMAQALDAAADEALGRRKR
jgi:hypothetical protein